MPKTKRKSYVVISSVKKRKTAKRVVGGVLKPRDVKFILFTNPVFEEIQVPVALKKDIFGRIRENTQKLKGQIIGAKYDGEYTNFVIVRVDKNTLTVFVDYSIDEYWTDGEI